MIIISNDALCLSYYGLSYNVLCWSYDVLCMSYDVLCLSYDVLCLTYDVLCLSYNVLCLSYDVLWCIVLVMNEICALCLSWMNMISMNKWMRSLWMNQYDQYEWINMICTCINEHDQYESMNMISMNEWTWSVWINEYNQYEWMNMIRMIQWIWSSVWMNIQNAVHPVCLPPQRMKCDVVWCHLWQCVT